MIREVTASSSQLYTQQNAICLSNRVVLNCCRRTRTPHDLYAPDG